MELFIRIKDGQPFEHPIFAENFRQAFPDVDVNNLLPEFARFERVAPQLTQNVYGKDPRVQYELGDDGVYRDVWYYDMMSDEEIKAKQDDVKARWAESGGFSSWTFDEETCSFLPPEPYPTTGLLYNWDEMSLSWIEVVLET